ncbi:pirin family protein [Paraburkholderia sp. LEh10]|uniref:pirin family protein n=1 Tax=Paraburkholderia sp. LEh10 TaxID=2821353 RepID=UPI001AE93E67|nr:pirin family protein [Paraburkholderia sp. LEh10]MBP0590421.1 pirin family protein [Paraburkholderia sp. LEh10]
MSLPLMQRAVAHVESPQFGRGLADTHRVRPLISAGDWAATDPFLLLMEDRYGPNVFSPHPHRGIETLTYLISGELEHYDNHGAQAVLTPGDAALLTAGRGIVHDERPVNGHEAHILQLWINLPRANKMSTARLQPLRWSELPLIRGNGYEVRLYSGAVGEVVSPTLNFTPFTFVDIRLEPGATFEHPLAADVNCFLVPLTGAVDAGAITSHIAAGQIAWLEHMTERSSVRITAHETGARLILAAGKPLREPVAARGPFVMNSAVELDLAYADFRAQQQRFGIDTPSNTTLQKGATV